MTLRIFYIIAAVIAAYIGFEIYTLSSGYKGLTDVPAEYAIGPEDTDLSVVEFLDYGCRWCREMHPIITEAVKKDGNVKYYPRPISSEDKEAIHAALLAYAAGRQGKFIAMHNEMIENYRILDENLVYELSEKIGLNFDQLSTDMEEGKIHEDVIENTRLYAKLNGQSVPLFIIGEKMFFVPTDRMPTVDDFLEIFDQARAMP